MEIIKSFFTSGSLLLLLLLSACEDPTSVGRDLVGIEGGDPVVSTLPFTVFETTDGRGVRDDAAQSLAGIVDDPILGQFQTSAYIDFDDASALPDDEAETYAAGPVDNVILRLDPTYVYGDTLQEITLALHESLSEFTGSGATLDSLPQIGPEITQFTFLPTDTLVSVVLPADWIAARDADLRSDDFETLFAGFHLAPISGNAIVGFANVSSSFSDLRSFVGEIEVAFSANKSITHFERTTDPEPMPSRIAVQNGIGPRLSIDFDTDMLGNVSINRTNIRLSIDREALPDPPNFTRPFVEEVSLMGIAADSSTLLLEIGTIDDAGIVDFNSEVVRSLFAAAVEGAEVFERYELIFEGNTVNALVLRDTTVAETPPSITLTVTPLN